ncbi:hypothetical protein M0804_008670 [Polistes exclamans]|nr:hypothetical protein M0804_008670 [Polistes exclamans]
MNKRREVDDDDNDDDYDEDEDEDEDENEEYLVCDLKHNDRSYHQHHHTITTTNTSSSSSSSSSGNHLCQHISFLSQTRREEKRREEKGRLVIGERKKGRECWGGWIAQHGELMEGLNGRMRMRKRRDVVWYGMVWYGGRNLVGTKHIPRAK